MAWAGFYCQGLFQVRGPQQIEFQDLQGVGPGARSLGAQGHPLALQMLAGLDARGHRGHAGDRLGVYLINRAQPFLGAGLFPGTLSRGGQKHNVRLGYGQLILAAGQAFEVVHRAFAGNRLYADAAIGALGVDHLGQYLAKGVVIAPWFAGAHGQGGHGRRRCGPGHTYNNQNQKTGCRQPLRISHRSTPYIPWWLDGIPPFAPWEKRPGTIKKNTNFLYCTI